MNFVDDVSSFNFTSHIIIILEQNFSGCYSLVTQVASISLEYIFFRTYVVSYLEHTVEPSSAEVLDVLESAANL